MSQRLRRLLLSLALSLPVLAAAAMGVGIVTRDRGALMLGILAGALVPAAAFAVYFTREEKVEL